MTGWTVISFVALTLYASCVQSQQCPNTKDISTTCQFDPAFNCNDNSQCPPEYACCTYGCGKSCLAAMGESHVHAGTCPETSQATNQLTCLHDHSCAFNEKCCSGVCTEVRPFQVPVLQIK